MTCSHRPLATGLTPCPACLTARAEQRMFPGQCRVPSPWKGVAEAGHSGCAGHWASVPSPPAVFCSRLLWLVPLGELLPDHGNLSLTPTCFRVMRPRVLVSWGASGSVDGLASAPLLLSVSLASPDCQSCAPGWGPHLCPGSQATSPTPSLSRQMRGRGFRWQVQVPARSGAGGAKKRGAGGRRVSAASAPTATSPELWPAVAFASGHSPLPSPVPAPRG